jgi:hypothetical protein
MSINISVAVFRSILDDGNYIQIIMRVYEGYLIIFSCQLN